MRQARIRTDDTTAVYHCVTRTVAGERLLDRHGKEVLRKMLWQVADFCGVEVLAYCIMSNHFHVLLRTTPEEDCETEELMRRYRVLYDGGNASMMPDPHVMVGILEEESDRSDVWKRRLMRRMCDVSEFMKTLKQRFSVWFNRSHSRFGTLWAERFKSTLVENDPCSLKTVAAYIDLNPVRAGLVEDPSDYRWSSFGEAMGGKIRSQEGLAAVMDERSWRDAAADYCTVLYGKGAVGRTGGQPVIPHEKVVQILSQGGKISRSNLLRCRLRYMTDGAVLGSEAFVRQVGSGLSPGKLPRPLKHLPMEGEEDLVVWRRLRMPAVQ